MSHRLTAPLRIDFCGGFTDVASIGCETGVGICSTAIDLYHDVQRVHRVGFGVDIAAEVRDAGRPGGYQAAIRALGGDSRFARSLALRSDLPDSTGLGSSGAMTAMLIAASDVFHHGTPDKRLDIVRRAHRLESSDLAFTTGYQDHLLAVFGRTHFVDRPLPDLDAADPFDLPAALAMAIDTDAFVVSAARKESSAGILNDIISRLREVRDGLVAIRRCNEVLHTQLLNGESVEAMFATIAEASSVRDKLSARMRHPVSDALRDALRPVVFATHALGAGGGTFVAYCRPSQRDAALAMLLPLRESGAVRVWFPKVNRRGLWIEHLA